MQEVTKYYQNCIELVKYEENLHFSQIFNSELFIKEMKFLKEKDFVTKMISTSMFSKFIESRIEPDSPELENHINFFDLLDRKKRTKAMPNLLESMLDNHRGEYHCEELKEAEKTYKILYQGKFPKLDEELLEEPEIIEIKNQSSKSWRIMQKFVSERDFQLLKDKEWTKVFLEAINTIWFVCLEIYIKVKPIRIKNEIYLYACQKLWELREQNFFINIQILLSTCFLAGFFEDDETFNKINHKFKKQVSNFNLKCTLISRFYSGVRHRKKFDKDFFKEKVKKISHLKIPNSISTHFETNEFCAQCGIYIPEEFIFGMFDRSLKTIKIDCPNKECKNRFEPKFNFVTLKVEGQADDRRSLRLINPVRLLKKINDFLFENCESEIFNEKKSEFLYWNILFYFNLASLPGFYIEDYITREVYNFSVIYLDNYYVSEGK